MTETERQERRGYQFCAHCWRNVRPVRAGSIDADWLCEHCTAAMLRGEISARAMEERRDMLAQHQKSYRWSES